MTLGYISGVHGVRGWVKVYSYTDPREAILQYQPWLLGPERKSVSVQDGRRHGSTVLASLPGVDSPEAARKLINQEICVPRAALPDTNEEQWYWTDLEGLKVVNLEGVELGTVQRLFETGANDVMVIDGDRERLVPFVQGHVVRSVDLPSGVVQVDWHEDD